jgi:hypothetical protein
MRRWLSCCSSRVLKLDATDIFGEMLLSLAVERGYEAVVMLLLATSKGRRGFKRQ